MEKHYTRKQMETLESLGVMQSFLTATHSDYKRGTTRKQDETVREIYEQATGKKEERNMNCPQCVLTLYRQAGTLYYKSKEYWEEYDRKKKEEEEKNNPDVEMKDGTITFNFERALEEEKKIKNNKEKKKDNGKTKK